MLSHPHPFFSRVSRISYVFHVLRTCRKLSVAGLQCELNLHILFMHYPAIIHLETNSEILLGKRAGGTFPPLIPEITLDRWGI